MVDALVGIAATIYIFKFIIGLFKPIQQSALLPKWTVARCAPKQACECSDETKTVKSGRPVKVSREGNWLMR